MGDRTRMALRRHLKGFSRLTPRDRRLVVEAAAVLCAVRLLLYVVPFRWLTRRMKPARFERPETNAARRETIASIVAAVAGYVPCATCLTRSIALYAMLRRRRYPVVLLIGVGRDQAVPASKGSFSAHAWVETEDGTPLPGNSRLGSTPLLTVPSAVNHV